MITDIVRSVVGGGLRAVRNAVLDNPAMSPQDPATWAAIANAPESEAGVRVSHTEALTVPAVWQALSLISGHMGVMTLNLQRQLPDDDWEVDHDHPWQFAVSTRWNADTSAFEGWSRLAAHTCLYGNGYALTVPGDPARDTPPELYTLLPDRTQKVYDPQAGKTYYVTEINGDIEVLPPAEVLHVKGLTLDARGGYDLITAARNSIGLAMAAQGFASRFFANGGQAGGFVELPPTWQNKAVANFEEGLYRKYTGRDNWFKIMLLRDGAKFHQSTIDAQKSQLQETREGQAREVARLFNMPPNKLGLEESQSYGSAEQAQLNYLTDCLAPRREAVAAECQIKLLTDAEQRSRSHRFRHDVMRIIELDVKTHNDVLIARRNAEVINANEFRRTIGMPKRTDPGGEQYVNPNAKAGDPGATPEAAAPSPPPTPNKTAAAAKATLREAVGRAVKVVTDRAADRAKAPAKFLAWLDGGAADELSLWRKIVTPAAGVTAVILDADAGDVADRLGGRFLNELLARLKPLVDPPHRQSQLAANAARECEAAAHGVADRLTDSVFGGNLWP